MSVYVCTYICLLLVTFIHSVIKSLLRHMHVLGSTLAMLAFSHYSHTHILRISLVLFTLCIFTWNDDRLSLLLFSLAKMVANRECSCQCCFFSFVFYFYHPRVYMAYDNVVDVGFTTVAVSTSFRVLRLCFVLFCCCCCWYNCC